MKSRYTVLLLSLVLALALAVPALGGPMNPIASISSSVKSIANKALKKAKAAQSAANGAQSTANTALSTANSAKTAASGAQTTANSALSNANTAQTEAKKAQTTANTAQTIAESKFGQTETVFGTSSGSVTTTGLSSIECPKGSSITGGGYSTGGTGNKEVVPVYTAAYGNAWLADLERIPSGTNTWEVTAIATCAKP